MVANILISFLQKRSRDQNLNNHFPTFPSQKNFSVKFGSKEENMNKLTLLKYFFFF